MLRFFQNRPLKGTIFFNIKKGKKWSNGQIIISRKESFKKGKFGRFGIFKYQNGNPAKCSQLLGAAVKCGNVSFENFATKS